MRISDWSSDVCSSDLLRRELRVRNAPAAMPVGGEAPEAVIAFERIAAVAHETEQAAEDRRVDPAIGRCGANLGEQVRLAKGRGTGECHHMLREHVERDRKSTRLNSSH